MNAVAVAAAWLAAAMLAGPVAAAMTADEILARARQQWQGSTFTATMTVEIVRPDATRTVRLEIWSTNDERAMVRVLAPAQDAGQGILRIGGNLWLYVPQARQPVLLPPTALAESFLGSDLSIEDVTRGLLAAYYTPTLVATEVVGASEAYVLDLRPTESAPVAYGRLRVWVRRSDYALLRVDYVDQRDTVTKRMLLLDVRSTGGHLVAPHAVIENLVRPGERTVIRLTRVAVDVAIPPSVFTLRYLTGGP